jgi:SAM-dependent methyltransferase
MHPGPGNVVLADMAESLFIRREQCPGCRSSRASRLLAADFLAPPLKDFLEAYYSAQGMIELRCLEGEIYELDECLDCSLIFQRSIPAEVLAETLYERWINPERARERYFQRQDFERRCFYAEEAMTVVQLCHTSAAPASVLDFGMGWGTWCLMAKAFGCDVYGLDLSETRARHAREQGINVLAWADLPGRQFDFINAEQVFEHLPDPLATLRHLRGSLKPAGLIKVGVPDGSDIKRRLRVLDWSAPPESRNSLNAVHPLEHLNCFTPKALLRMASLAGLAPRDVPLGIRYASLTQWSPLKGMARNLLRPLARHLFPRGTYRFFGQASGFPPS